MERLLNAEHADLAQDLAKYQNMWVALAEPNEKVVGSGSDAWEAKVDAERRGYTEVTLLRVRSFHKHFVLRAK
jgi:hypothetical protein